MQSAAVSSILLHRLLPEILERLSVSTKEGQENIENLLLDLHKLLGRRLVPAALHLLDNRTIVIYTNSSKTIEIAEIFKAGSVHNLHTPGTGPYTCQHVLALRLAVALQHKCLEFKEVPNDKLDLMLNHFLPNYTSEED